MASVEGDEGAFNRLRDGRDDPDGNDRCRGPDRGGGRDLGHEGDVERLERSPRGRAGKEGILDGQIVDPDTIEMCHRQVIATAAIVGCNQMKRQK